MWENTKKRLKELELNLICRKCNKIVSDPHILGSCDHFFCRVCIKDHVGKVCPVCTLPSFAADVNQNQRIAGLVRTCQELRTIIELQQTDIHIEESTHSATKCPADINEGSILKSIPQTTASDSDLESDNENIIMVRNDFSAGKSKLNVTPQSGKSSSTQASSHSSFSPKTLSPAGSIINRRNKKGETPLHTAAIKGRLDDITRLLKLGANLNAKDNAGWTPLHEACNHGHSETVKLLLENGASINIPGFENATPLHDAVNAGRFDIVKLLLSRGADPNRRNAKGCTAIDIAKDEGMKQVLLSSEYQLNSKPEVSVIAPLLTTDLVLLCTGLDDAQRALLESFAKLYYAKIVHSFSAEVTHLVAQCSDDGTCPRTFKYLSAVATGKWIVSFKWIEESLQIGKLMAEDTFEVNGTRQWLKSQGPKRGRLNANEQNPSLFSGCYFYFSGNFPPPGLQKADLIQLVRLAGGVVLSREPKPDILDDQELTVPYHAKVKGPLEHCSHFIIYHPESRKHTSILYKSKFLKSLPLNWLLDCISKFEIMDP